MSASTGRVSYRRECYYKRMIEATRHEEEATHHLRDLVINGQVYETDLPTYVNPFNSDATDITTDMLNPRDLDLLAPGSYTISFAGEDQVKPYVVARSIIISEGPQGLVVDRETFNPAFGDDSQLGWTLLPDGIQIMQSLGYAIGEDELGCYISGIPTPQTFQRAAAKQGIEIEFFDQKEIRSPDYLLAFSQGNYPVSYAYYDHDISDDHITALVLGGEPIMRSLKRIAGEGLNRDREFQDSLTAGIDTYTMVYRAAISTGLNTIMAQDKTAQEWVHQVGQEIGLTVDEINAILAAGRTKRDLTVS